MFDLLDEIKEMICEEEEYQKFLAANQKLENVNQLLTDYQQAANQYYTHRKYEKYIDISSYKNKFLELKKKVNETKEVQEYYNAYYEVNDLLDELTEIIFAGISEIELERYSL